MIEIFICAIALQHLAFLVLEMFLWRKPAGLKVFHMDQAQADATAVLAMNQGLYNGFLAAGLAWGASGWMGAASRPIEIFFLACVAIAGLFGGATAARSILVIQALPAILVLAWRLAA